MQTNDQLTNFQRVTTSASNTFNEIPYKAESTHTFRHVKPTQASHNELHQKKLRLDSKLTEFDLFRAIQQYSGNNTISLSSTKDTPNILPPNSMKLFRSETSNGHGHGTGKARKTKSKTSPSKKAESKLQYLTNTSAQQGKRILPKVPNNAKCEVKKFAPEMNGLLTDLSSALKTNLYSNQIMVSATTFPLPKCSNVYQSAKTTAKNFDEAKYNLLFGQKARSDLLKTTKEHRLTNDFINYVPFKAHFAEEKTSSRSTSISTREYLNDLKNTYKKSIEQKEKPYQSLSKFFCEPSLEKRLNRNEPDSRIINSPNNSRGIDSRTAVSSIGQSDLETMKEMRSSSPLYGFPKNLAKTQNFNNKIPDLLRDIEKPRSRERKTVITPTPNMKVESIKGFSELYENAVKNVLSIEVFPENKTFTAKNKQTPGNFKPKYNLDKEIEAVMKNFKELDEKPIESNLFNFNNFQSDFNNSLREINGQYKNRLTSNILPPSLTVKVSEKDFNPKSINMSTTYNLTTTKYNPTTDKFIGYTLTELLDTNETIHSPKNKTEKKKDTDKEFNNQTFQTDLSWLYTPTLFKTFPPPVLPPQPTYLHNVFLPYQDHMPKLSTKESVTEIKVCDIEIPDNKGIIKTSTPIPPESPSFSRPSEEEDDEIKNITCTDRKANVSNSRRSTPVTPIEKKARPLKYRPYRLRDRTKASKKICEMMQELAKEPEKPNYVLKEIDEFSSTKEIFLGEIGLRRILR